MKTKWYHLDSIDSTNTWAKSNFALFTPDTLHVITAREQTAGRGRFGRQWVSPPGKNCCLSFAFFWPDRTVCPFLFSQFSALCLQELLRRLHVSATVKWPNDLLIGDKKIAGILVETELLEHQMQVVIGTGLNVNMAPEELAAIPKKATSLYTETGRLFSVEDIQQAYTELFAEKLSEFSYTQERWRKEVLWMINQQISVQTPTGYVIGRIIRFFDDGSLQLLTDSNQLLVIHNGELRY